MARAQSGLDRANLLVESDGEQCAARCFSWVLHRKGCAPIEVRFLPEATRLEAEAHYPGSRAERIDTESNQ